MPRRHRLASELSLSHEDLLNALFEALEVKSREDRTSMRERYFHRLAEEAGGQPGRSHLDLE